MASRGMASRAEKLRDLVRLVRFEPTVASCIRRMRNFVLVDGFEVKETGGELAADLRKKIEPAYMELLAGAIEIMHTCGFVAFYVRKRDGVPLPHLLPLGSFLWSVEEAPSSAPEVFCYKLTIIAGNVKEEEVTIVSFTPPLKTDMLLASPLDGVLSWHIKLQEFLECKRQVARHNSQKHIVMTERVDLKDQTTDGIMLLDEFRRYNVLGSHPAVRHQQRLNLLASGGQQRSTENINDANWHWLNTAFAPNESVDAKLLPPNTDTHELNEIKFEMTEGEIEHYVNVVHMFFDLPPPSHSMGRAATAEMALLSREQFTNVRTICDFLQKVCCTAYSKCFKVDLHLLDAIIDPGSRLSINSCDDVKKLMESQVLTTADRLTIRSMFFHRGKRPRVM